MATGYYSFREVRFVIEDEATHAYVLLDADHECPVSVIGWHHKAFPPIQSIQDILACGEIAEAATWESKNPKTATTIERLRETGKLLPSSAPDEMVFVRPFRFPVFVSTLGDPSVGIDGESIEILGLDAFVDDGREALRERLALCFSEILDTKAVVRFGDECESCGNRVTPAGFCPRCQIEPGTTATAEPEAHVRLSIALPRDKAKRLAERGHAIVGSLVAIEFESRLPD